MLDGAKLAEANLKLTNITRDLSWIDYNNDSRLAPTFNVMAVKSLILQLKDVERILTESIEDIEVKDERNKMDK